MELMNLVFIALRQLHQALIVCNVPDLWMHTSTSMRMSHARGPRQTDDASTLDTHNPNGRGRRGCVTTESPNPPPVEAVCTPLAHNHIDWRREPVLNPAQCALRVGEGWGAQGSRERTQGLEQTLSEELFQLGDLGPTVLSRCLGSIVPDRLVPSPSAPTGPPLHRAACNVDFSGFPGFEQAAGFEGCLSTRGRGTVSTMADKHTCDSAEGAARGSRWPMISIEEANRISLLHTVPLPAAAVPLALSLGRVLAEDVLAREVRMSRCETWRPECGAHEMLTCASRSPFPRCRR